MKTTASLWCGIDLSKGHFDAAFVIDETELSFSSIPVFTFSHSQEGIYSFLNELKHYAKERDIPFSACRIVMESTGRYSTALYGGIVEQVPFLAPAVINPAKAFNFLKSLGLRNKTDAVDARALGIYGRDRKPAPYQPLTKDHQDLREMFRLRSALVEQRTANRLRLKELPSGKAASLLQKVLKEVEKGIIKCEAEFKKILNKNVQMRRDVNLLMTIPGVGLLTAVAILAEIGDLRRFKRSRQATAYAGLSPRITESGSSVRRRSRLSRVGNPSIRKALYMAALASVRSRKSCMAQYFERLVGSGKSRKVALGAVMRKLVVLMRAVPLSQQRYCYPQEDQQPVENSQEIHPKLRLVPRF